MCFYCFVNLTVDVVLIKKTSKSISSFGLISFFKQLGMSRI